MDKLDENHDRIAQFIIAFLVFNVIGMVSTIALVALAGPYIQHFFKGLPW